MGMFDTIVIEGLKLPKLPKEIDSYLKKNNHQGFKNFQTKDLDNYLGVYIFKNDGQIYQEVNKPTGKKKPYEPFTTKWADNRAFLEKIYYKFKNKSLLGAVPRYVQETKRTLQKTKITTTINFYDTDEVNGRYVEVDYCAKVIDGKIKSITLVKAELEPENAAKKRVAERIQFDKKLEESFKLRRDFISKWYYPVLREIYNPFILFSRLSVQWLCNRILKATYKWHGI